MQTYARIANGIVVEIIGPLMDGEDNEIPIAERFTPELVATMVDITDASPEPEQWWTASEVDGAWTFAAPITAS